LSDFDRNGVDYHVTAQFLRKSSAAIRVSIGLGSVNAMRQFYDGLPLKGPIQFRRAMPALV
jgi:hypothetical protein